MRISWSWVITPILDEKSNHIIHTFRNILYGMNLITDYIDEIEGGKYTVSIDKSRTNKVHLVHFMICVGFRIVYLFLDQLSESYIKVSIPIGFSNMLQQPYNPSDMLSIQGFKSPPRLLCHNVQKAYFLPH